MKRGRGEGAVLDRDVFLGVALGAQQAGGDHQEQKRN
jgi:hypothetical protein